jgi:hypothetical protein
MELVFDNCEFGIGIRIIGGFEYGGRFYQIFIREILENGVAFCDGRIHEGDQLLAINDISCVNLFKKKYFDLIILKSRLPHKTNYLRLLSKLTKYNSIVAKLVCYWQTSFAY